MSLESHIDNEFLLSNKKSVSWLAWASIGASALMFMWLLMSPRQVMGQAASKNTVVMVSEVGNAIKPAPAAKTIKPAAQDANSRMTAEERQRMREQIIETSKQNKKTNLPAK